MLWFFATVSLVGFPLFTALALVRSRRAIRAQDPDVDTACDALPPVTVLKPCAGADDVLESCIASHFTQRHVDVQILFGVADARDPAVGIIETAIAAQPARDAALVVTGAARFASGKIANLAGLLPYARHELLWITDSNTLAHPDMLAGMVRTLRADPRIGCVAAAVAGVGERSHASALENLHLGVFAGGGTFVANAVTGLAGTGKSVLVARATLDRIGGLDVLGAYAGDDLVLFRRIRALGLRIAIADHVVANVSARATFAQVLARNLRWTRIRICAVPCAAALEPLLSPLVPCALLAILHAGSTALTLFALAFVEQFVADVAVLRRMRVQPFALRYAPWIALRPFFNLAVWLRALFPLETAWRGRRVRIAAGSRIVLATEPRPPP